MNGYWDPQLVCNGLFMSFALRSVPFGFSIFTSFRKLIRGDLLIYATSFLWDESHGSLVAPWGVYEDPGRLDSAKRSSAWCFGAHQRNVGDLKAEPVSDMLPIFLRYLFRILYSCGLIWNCHFFQGRSRINCRWTKIIHAKYCLEMVKCILASLGTKSGACGVFKPWVTCLFKDWQRTITYLDDDILILRDDGDPLVSLEGCAFCGFSALQLLFRVHPSEAVYRISTWSARFTCDLRETPQSRLSAREQS